MPTYLFVECQGTTYFASISDLEGVKRVWNGDDVDRGGSVFLPLTAFQKLKV